MRTHPPLAPALSWFGALALTAAAAAAGAATSTPAPPDLRDDRRLAARITLVEAGRPLGELLPELGRKLGVRLAARRETADDRATLFLDDRPAAAALALLARHLDFQWYPSGSGYELGQSPEAARRESGLRDREWEAVQGWMEHLYRLSRTPEDRLRARQREVDAALGREGLSPQERAALTREQAALRDIFRHSRVVPVALEVYHSLSPLQRRQLRGTGSLRLSSAFGGLSPRLIGAAVTAMERPVRPLVQPGQPEPPVFVDVVFRLTDAGRDYQRGGSRVPRQVRLNAFLTVATENGSSMVNMSPRSLVDVPLPALGSVPPPNDPELDRAVPLSFPRPEPIGPAVPVIQDRLAEWTDGMLPLGELARQVHAATGLEVVADEYIRARMRPEELAGKQTVRTLMDRVASELGYAWWKEGKTLFLRSRSYHNDRPAEVPQRLVRSWARRVAGKACPSLDDLGELALQVTDPQARGLNDYWGWCFAGTGIPAPSFSGGFFQLRHDLRFWGSLNRRQKDGLLAGQPLPAPAMDLRQRRLYLFALTEPADGDWTGREIRQIPPRPLAPGAASVPPWAVFRVSRREVEMQVYANERGDHVTEIRGVGAPSFHRGFGFRPERRDPVGAPSRAENLTLIYDLSRENTPNRASQVYVFSAP